MALQISRLDLDTTHELIDPARDFALSAWRSAWHFSDASPPSDLTADEFRQTFIMDDTTPSAGQGAFLVAHNGPIIYGVLGYKPYIYTKTYLAQLDFEAGGEKYMEAVHLYANEEEEDKGVEQELIRGMEREIKMLGPDYGGVYVGTHTLEVCNKFQEMGWERLVKEEGGGQNTWNLVKRW